WTRPIRSISREGILATHCRIGKVEKHPAFANGCMRVLSSVLNYAIARKLLLENPINILSETRAYFEEKPRTRHIRVHELPAFSRAIRSIREANEFPSAAVGSDFIEWLLHTGLRRSEGALLKWTDIDLASDTLTICDTKNGSDHTLPLTTSMREILNRRRDATPDSVFVFAATRGSGKRSYREPRGILTAIRASTGIAFSCHDLRRTFISIANQLDVSYPTMKRLVNHSAGSDVTLSYVQVSLDRVRDAMERIESFIITKSMEPNTNAFRITA
ncbi:MAG: tyrosine-type recombinase/integrase, partial [Fimbriimonadaceae bacterium]|nr:tyrosine-type recombinase/integrase [Fimbriimonadaceae bacterium]